MQCEMMKLKNKIKFQWSKKKRLKQKKVTKHLCNSKCFVSLWKMNSPTLLSSS
jgi:hypothetical protein